MYYSLNQGNQNQLILDPGKTIDWIELTKRNYSWEKYSEDDNRLDEYMEYLFDVLPDLGNASDDDLDFWEQLTKGQKMFYSILVFEGAVDNGGIFQFFWERSEHIYAFDEVLEILQIQPLQDDYNRLVDRYEIVAKQLEALRMGINYNNKKWEQHYHEAYDQGMAIFGEDYELEGYYYDAEFKKQFHKAFCDYIEHHLEEFISLSGPLL
ncbi:MAG TPA: hypothetical protein VL947_02310 [Cytophagales bacterium]|nr:hypothetical protein [Cytophagales bacterium]